MPKRIAEGDLAAILAVVVGKPDGVSHQDIARAGVLATSVTAAHASVSAKKRGPGRRLATKVGSCGPIPAGGASRHGCGIGGSIVRGADFASWLSDPAISPPTA